MNKPQITNKTITTMSQQANEKKYVILENETIEVNLRVLYRIQALKNFSDVKKGDKGGWVEGYHNLSQGGDCWVYDEACVYDFALVVDNAKISGNARVYDEACIYDYSEIYDEAEIYDKAKISGNSKIYGDAKIFDNAWINDNSVIYGDTQVYTNAKIIGNAVIEKKFRLQCFQKQLVFW